MKETRKKHSTTKIISIVLLIALYFVWHFTLGYHNHKVVIHTGDNTIILESSQSVFDFALPDQAAKPMNEYAINKYSLTSETGKPFSINGHGIIITKQIINLPDSVSTYEFIVNGLDFSLNNGLLQSNGQKWEISSNKPLRINVDSLI